ncbi:MAG: hypothetical protein LBB89_07490 [Treponema sp.]|jgi:hypothetical protein|nr:hypothetical protein [Treponema sp.]
MKRFIIGFIFIMMTNVLYSEGSQEVLNEAVRESQHPDSFSMTEGIKMGQSLFINVITEMEKNGDTNYDIEYITNNYVDYIASHTYLKQYQTTYDWARFITENNILTFHYAFDTFFKLLDMYLWKKKTIQFHDSNYEEDDDDY